MYFKLYRYGMILNAVHTVEFSAKQEISNNDPRVTGHDSLTPVS